MKIAIATRQQAFRLLFLLLQNKSKCLFICYNGFILTLLEIIIYQAYVNRSQNLGLAVLLITLAG